MKITIDDLRRAIVNGGDVTSFAEVYEGALEGVPIPVVSHFDLTLWLPSRYVLAEGVAGGCSMIDFREWRDSDRGTHASEPDLDLTTLEISDVSTPNGFAAAIEDFNPDIIVLDRSPEELSTRALYAFSLPCAVGLSVQMELIRHGVVELHFNGSCRPGDAEETAIIESWQRRIPLLAIGLRPGTSGSATDDEALHMASRIKDGARLFGRNGRKPRLMAIIDSGRHTDSKRLRTSLMENVNSNQYTPQEPESDGNSVIVVGHVLDDPKETQYGNDSEITKARQLFAAAFERAIRKSNDEALSPGEASAILTEIVSRTRAHADVVRGTSVRGTIAFGEILDSLSSMNGGLTLGSIGKAAMIALPPRLSVRPTADGTAVTRDITNEVLYGVRFSGKIDRSSEQEATSLRPEDYAGQLDGARRGQTRQTSKAQGTESFAVVPDRSEEPASGVSGENPDGRKQDLEERYLSAKRALMSLIGDLEAQLRAGEITRDEFERHAAGLMARFRDSIRSAMRMSQQEIATTIVQMMDAQDKQWNTEVSFSTMQVYYHIKGTSEGVDLGPFKQDYHALKWLIDDLQTENILRPTGDASGFLLTGIALEVLLKQLLDRRGGEQARRITRDPNQSPATERSHEIRRYHRGDRFHDLSIRHTLREIARHKRSLPEVRESDLRVVLKERRRPRSDIVMCIDTSGSMGFGQRLTCARLVAAGLVKAAFRDGDRAGIVGFGDRGHSVVPLTENEPDLLMNGIAALNAKGNTNIGDGIKAARELLLASGSRSQKHIILITDGKASAVSEESFARLSSVSERDITEESALWETRRAAAAGVRVSVVYIAPRDEQVDSFVRNIAEIGRGKIHRMSNLADLESVLCPSTGRASQQQRRRGF